ncbi:MAG TPA: tetratricopeptide repeat protein, partial [Planctomycetota bacterium]|nr:tetratricopeptide repeat protein [Planctomycetota bacterium]
MVTSCVSFVRARCSARRAAAWRTSLATIAALACVLPSAVCAQAAPAPQSAPAAARPTQADRLAAAQVVSQAVALLNAGRSAEAIPALEKLTQEQPDASQAWFLLGAALHTSGQLDRALVAHTRAATFPDVRASALYNVACVHALQGRTNEAIATLKTALADPNGPQLRAQMLADSDLQSLRGDPRWLELVAPAAAGKPFREDVKVLHVWHGGSAGEQFGWEAVDAGDVDGDGVHDVLASAPFHRAATSTAAAGAAGASGAGATSGAGPNGRVTMHSGRSGAVLWARVGEPGEQLGLGISAAGDVDGDGQADVIVGAPAPRATAASSGAD